MAEDNKNRTKKNSFKELERQQAEQYRKNTEVVGNRVKGSLGTIGLISEIVELYFSRIVDVFLKLSAGPESPINNLEKEEEE